MNKRIVLIVILVAAAVFGYYYYKHHQDEVRMANGEVTCDGCMTPEEHARFLKENAGETADSQSERRAKTPVTGEAKTAAASGTGTASSTVSAAAADQNAQTAQTTQTTLAAPAASAAKQVLAAPGAAPASADASTTAAPASDTVAPNPTNGMVFGGKGTYQWYRQGNLTWRVDTTSGRSCIIYATMEEWRKRIVMSHGCGRSA